MGLIGDPLNEAMVGRATRISAAGYVRTVDAIRSHSRTVVGFWDDHDVLLTPTLTQPPFEIGHFGGNPEEAIHEALKARKVEPLPASLNTLICPPNCVTMLWTVARPSPVPRPGSLVVKYGSNSRARVSSSMPGPVSLTESMTT